MLVLDRLRDSGVGEQTWPLGRHGCRWLSERGCTGGVRATGFITCPVLGLADGGGDCGRRFLLAGSVAVLLLPSCCSGRMLDPRGSDGGGCPWSCPSWRHHFGVSLRHWPYHLSSVDCTCGGLRRLKAVLLCLFVVCFVVVGVVCPCPAPLYLALGVCVVVWWWRVFVTVFSDIAVEIGRASCRERV